MIEGIRGTAPGPRGPSRTTRGTGFQLPAARAASTAACAAVAGTHALLGLQQSWTPAERDDAAQRRGHAVLEELAQLQRDLLRGGADPARLSRLTAMADGESGHDPALRDIVEGIGLRARVELARLRG